MVLQARPAAPNFDDIGALNFNTNAWKCKTAKIDTHCLTCGKSIKRGSLISTISIDGGHYWECGAFGGCIALKLPEFHRNALVTFRRKCGTDVAWTLETAQAHGVTRCAVRALLLEGLVVSDCFGFYSAAR